MLTIWRPAQQPTVAIEAIGTPVEGKNVATVDNGFTVPAAGCYVGYTLTTTTAGTQAGKYPICVAGNDIEGGMIMRYTGGSDYSFASYTGKGFGCLTVAITLDGEFPDNMVSVAPSFKTVYAPLGGKGTAKAQIKNLSVDPITSLGYTVTDGAGTVSAEQTYDMSSEPLAALKTATAYFEMDASATVCLDQRTITITKVNGNAVASTENITSKGTLDTKAKMYPRTALIEKFTGQSCPNCPAGEKVIVAAVEGLKDPSRVAVSTTTPDIMMTSSPLRKARALPLTLASTTLRAVCSTAHSRKSASALKTMTVWHGTPAI